jgi:hypothetical protein
MSTSIGLVVEELEAGLLLAMIWSRGELGAELEFRLTWPDSSLQGNELPEI